MDNYNKEMTKTYEPSQVEDRRYNNWIEGRYFHAVPDNTKKPYTIVMPPPNITGQLHMGHALDSTLQDILTRWRRMQGYSALWLPGTDHASIATEAKIVEAMAKEGIKKDDIGREAFLVRAWEWKAHYGGRIVEQLKKLGCSCDWERERFTMDEGLSGAVREVFVRLYNKGLIYRGERMVNWCPVCGTSISDAEVEYEERDTNLWYIRYPTVDGTDGIVVATTRPETMLGDTAVAVNPKDERYSHLVGKMLNLPLTDRIIPVIADDMVEIDFGTGAVKITPAHDPNDFETGERHGLQVIKVIDGSGNMNENAGGYCGIDRHDARKSIVTELEKQGLLVKTDKYTHNVGSCYRCNTIIEPMTSLQWFVRMKPLAEPAINVVEEGITSFIPDRFSKIYYNWMENIRDWCISRQLWWGHRIPAWYCGECGEMTVLADEPGACEHCGSKDIKQDEDVLDTWFSSALWPFSTLGWPQETEDMKYYYPTSVLVTGYDIIFFWVARMIFSALEQTGREPFQHVLIHGMVRDSQGRKMTKSLGNGIDPLEIIKDYGTDAIRYALIMGISPGNDLRFSTEKAEAGRNFANKIWNAARFVVSYLKDIDGDPGLNADELTIADKWIISRANTLVREATDNMERFELGVALQKIYEFIWEEFCDWYIELAKPRLYSDDKNTKNTAAKVLNRIMIISVKLLHPYMPFVTAEIYDYLVHDGKDIIISDWPEFELGYIYEEESSRMALIMDIIRGIRNIRAEMNVHPGKKTKLIAVVTSEREELTVSEGITYLQKLAGVNSVEIRKNKDGVPSDAAALVNPGVEIYIPMEELVDIKKELERLSKEKADLEKEIIRVNSKLNNQGFVSKAPQKVVEEEKTKKIHYEEMYNKISERLIMLSKKFGGR